MVQHKCLGESWCVFAVSQYLTKYTSHISVRIHLKGKIIIYRLKSTKETWNWCRLNWRGNNKKKEKEKSKQDPVQFIRMSYFTHFEHSNEHTHTHEMTCWQPSQQLWQWCWELCVINPMHRSECELTGLVALRSDIIGLCVTAWTLWSRSDSLLHIPLPRERSSDCAKLLHYAALMPSISCRGVCSFCKMTVIEHL